MTDKKQEISIEGKIGHYTGVLHQLVHSRSELPPHCDIAAKSLDTAIEKTAALLTSLVDSEMPRAH